MGSGVVEERVRAIAAVRGDGTASPERVRQALRDIASVRAWLASSEAELTRALASLVSFPERDVADCTRGSLTEATRTKERADTLDRSPSMADALDRADITVGHVDEVTRTVKSLDDDGQRAELFGRLDRGLLDVATAATVAEFRRRLAMEAKNIRRDDGVDRLERQRRATRVRTWTDGEGMVCLSGRFDPITGTRLVARLDAATQALFAEAVPDTCPTDPIEKQHHLQGLALASLVAGEAPAGRSGRPEYVVVIDSSERARPRSRHPARQPGPAPGAAGALRRVRDPRVLGSLRPLQAPPRDLVAPRRPDRSRQSASLCAHHHAKVHDAGWELALGSARELTIAFPDGTVHNTGPPRRRAA